MAGVQGLHSDAVVPAPHESVALPRLNLAKLGIYAFDGTNQDDTDTGAAWEAVAHDTNIFRFFSAYEGYELGTSNVQCDYVPGVGTRFSILGVALILALIFLA